MTKAMGEFQRAVHVAQETGTAEEAAWAYLYFFRHMIDGHPVDLAPAMLPLVRAAVTKAGSPGTSAFLHMCVSVLEGHNGRLNEAARHCETAHSLVSIAQNAWLKCGNLLNRAAILLAGCRFSDAMKVLESLREEAARHGLNHESAQAEANLGHLYAMVGDHPRALETLSKVARSPSAPRLAALSACEGMARAYLSQGRLEQCQEVLEQLDTAAAEDEALASAYSVRWASITRARLYLALGQPDTAIQHLHRVAERYRDAADTPFSATVSMMTAQALATHGRVREAAFQLVQADRLGATAFRELQGQFYDAVASTLPIRESELASLLRRRAIDIWKEQGTSGVQGRNEASPELSRTPQVASAQTAVNSLASTSTWPTTQGSV
jgi:tetratricopeptide (TPR) repeat protein